jgi:hypothetical protein
MHGRRYDAHVDPDDLAAAGARDLPCLQRMQESWDKGARQGPDLVQVPVVRGTSVRGSGTVTTSSTRSGNVTAAAGAAAKTVASMLLRTDHGESCNGIGDARLVLIGG